MNIFDIVAWDQTLLNEADDFTVVRQGTGRNTVYNIVGPDGNVVGSERTPGRARTVASELSARNAAPPAPSNNGSTAGAPQGASKPPVETSDLSAAERRQLSRHGRVTVAGHEYTRAEIENNTRTAQIRRNQSMRDAGRDTPERARIRDRVKQLSQEQKAAFRSAWTKFFNPGSWLIRSLGSFGVSVAVYEALEERMLELYYQHHILRPGDPDYLDDREYAYAVQSYFGFWVGTTIIPAIRAGLLVANTVRRFIQIIRAANLTRAAITQGLSAATGPGFLLTGAVNIIFLVVSEIAFYFAARYVLSSDKAKDLIATFLVSSLMHELFAALDISAQEIAGSDFMQNIISTFDEQTAREAEADFRRVTGLDPVSQGERAMPTRQTPSGPVTATGEPETPAPAPAAAPNRSRIGIAPEFRN